MALPNVLIVGAGVTGTFLSLLLKEMGIPVRLVEKSRGAGGRMATHRLRLGGRDTPIVSRADLGAQYVTTRLPPDHAVMGPVYKSLLDANVLHLFEGEVEGPNPYGGSGPEIRHFVAQKGLQTIAEHFLERSGVEVSWDVAIGELELLEDGGVNIQAKSGSSGGELPSLGNSEAGAPRHIVVLTAPAPQVLGGSKFPMKVPMNEEAAAALAKVEFSSRFVVAYFFEPSVFSWPHAYTCRYFDKGDVRYLAHDTGKRGPGEETYVSILVHSGVPMAMELKDEAAPFPEAAARLSADLSQKMPEVPWEKAHTVKHHKWLYSQVYKGISAKRPNPEWTWDSGDNGFPGCLELFKTDRALGLMAGDSMAPAGNFEGCIFSAHRTAEAIKAYVDSLAVKSDL